MADKDVDPPVGSLAESIALARLIEAEQIAANKEVARRRNGLISRMRHLKANGATVETLNEMAAQIRALPPSPSARDAAASAVGLKRAAYQVAREIVAAAEKEPERYGDLLPMLDTQGPYVTHGVFRKRRGGAVFKPRKSEAHSANELLRKSHRPQHNDMVDRAVRTLEGAVMGLKLVDLEQLDIKRLSPWLAVIADTAFYLQALHKEMLNLYDEE